jgi:hypothetical protein
MPIVPKALAQPAAPNVSASWYQGIGYRRFGDAILRVDRIEAIAQEARRLTRSGDFTISEALLTLGGAAAAELPAILQGLGYREVSVGRYRAAKQPRRREATLPANETSSPFAGLRARLAVR